MKMSEIFHQFMTGGTHFMCQIQKISEHAQEPPESS